MTPGDMLQLEDDIKSNFRKVIYGRKGDVVRLIAIHGEVLIVEDKHSRRFPVKDIKVKQLHEQTTPIEADL